MSARAPKVGQTQKTLASPQTLSRACMKGAGHETIEVADFVVDRHLHHGCVVEQCILVERGQVVAKSRTVVIYYHGRDTFGGLWFLLMTFLMRFIFLFLFFPCHPGQHL